MACKCCAVCREAFATQISPVVFCHNDLQENNILYLEPSAAATLAATAPLNGNGNGSGGVRGHLDSAVNLLPIDFEYCSYNYRGCVLPPPLASRHPLDSHANYISHILNMLYNYSYTLRIEWIGETISTNGPSAMRTSRSPAIFSISKTTQIARKW